MKHCPMCGVKYSDAIAICAYDQTPLEPYDPAPAPISEEATNRKPVSRVGAPLINSDRQKVIKFGAIVFVIMGIIPPWKEVITKGEFRRWRFDDNVSRIQVPTLALLPPVKVFCRFNGNRLPQFQEVQPTF